MKAKLMLRSRSALGEAEFVEIVVWEVPSPVRGSGHSFKYRLAYVVDGSCVVRYDNERGKGDHKHLGQQELPIEFTDIDSLIEAFWKDVDNWST